MTVVRFTDQDMREWDIADRKTPRTRKLFELAKSHAEHSGGLTLKLWQLHMGRLWGIPVMMTLDDAAKHVKIPVPQAQQVFDDTMTAIRSEWETSPEYTVEWDPHG